MKKHNNSLKSIGSYISNSTILLVGFGRKSKTLWCRHTYVSVSVEWNTNFLCMSGNSVSRMIESETVSHSAILSLVGSSDILALNI